MSGDEEIRRQARWGGQVSSPHDEANLVAFLASAEAVKAANEAFHRYEDASAEGRACLMLTFTTNRSRPNCDLL